MRWLLAILMCMVLFGCRARDERPLAIVASGDTAGWIVPCGCASNQYGGLPRRGTYIEQLRAEMDAIVADVGGAAGGTSPYDRLKLEAILRGELAMGVAAHNIGAAEAAFGPDALADLAHRLGAPLVSANVRRANGELVAEPVRIVQAAGRRIALTGVLDPQYAKGPLRADPPREAVLEALRTVAGRYDAAIVLAYLPADRLRTLAASLPEVDVVVGGPTGQPIAPETVGPTLLASTTSHGKFLARFDAPLRGGSARWTGAIVPMDEQLTDDPRQMANLRAYYDELGARDFTARESGLAGPLRGELPETYRVAGSARCRECHEEDDMIWAESKHAHAWDALTRKGPQVDPFCQRCHTTGYGLPGGFVSARRSAALVHVGCESCHGPSQGHCRNDKVRTAYYARAKDSCAGCHDRENSPQFAYDDYWKRIEHGPDTPGAPAQTAAGSKTTEDPR
jgi:hypothetical protein